MGPPLDACMSSQHFSPAMCNSRSHSLACCMLCSFINRGFLLNQPGVLHHHNDWRHLCTCRNEHTTYSLYNSSEWLNHGAVISRHFRSQPLSFITFIEFENNSVCTKLELFAQKRNFCQRTCYGSLPLPA